MSGGPVSNAMESSMLSLYGASGDFNKRKGSNDGVVDFASAKRVRSEYFPAGRFNDSEGSGPTNVLDTHGRKPQGLSKNLANNQTEKTLYINIPRFIVPVVLPNSHGPGPNLNMILKKSVVAGDVVFHLRYNTHMVATRIATDVNTRAASPQMCFTINLPTVNYIIMNLHRYLTHYQDIMLQCGEGAPSVAGVRVGCTNFYAQIHTRHAELGQRKLSTWDQFFKKISHDSGPDAFANLMHTTATGAGVHHMSFFGKWYAKVYALEDAYQYEVAPAIADAAYLLRFNTAMNARRTMLSKYIAKVVWHFVRTYIKVGGVFIGSDNQGGNDQGESNPCSFLSTDYVGTIQVAGKTLKVKNLWSWSPNGLRSGDVLGFRLAEQELHNNQSNEVSFHLSSNPAIPHGACLYGSSAQNTTDIVDGGRRIEPLVLVPCILDAPMPWEGPRPLRFCEGVPYFLQFGVSNQMSKQFNQSSDQMLYSTNACATSDLVYIEVFMRFNVIHVRDTHREMMRDIRHKFALETKRAGALAAIVVAAAAATAAATGVLGGDAVAGAAAVTAAVTAAGASPAGVPLALQTLHNAHLTYGNAPRVVAESRLDVGADTPAAGPALADTRSRVPPRQQGGNKKNTNTES